MSRHDQLLPYQKEYFAYLGKEGEKLRQSVSLLEMPPNELQELVRKQINKNTNLTEAEKEMFSGLTKVQMIELFSILPLDEIKVAKVIRDSTSKDVFLVHPEPIAFGGYGSVYKGFSGKFLRAVAMKTLLKDSPENTEKLQREVWAQANEEHPNIVKIYSYIPQAKSADADFHEKAVVVMEYLGPERSELLHHFTNVTPEEAVSLCDQLCSAIESMDKPQKSRLKRMMTPWASKPNQGASLLHLDIKPRNILITHDGVVKLTDFGIASSVYNLAASSEVVHGSPDWMTPERLRGEVLDVSTELFSLTSVLYHTLTGDSFFSSPNTLQTLTRIIEEPFAMTKKLTVYCEKNGLNPKAVENFFTVAWSKKKEDRFKNIDQYRKAFALAMTRVNKA